jgi:hypothetical protein
MESHLQGVSLGMKNRWSLRNGFAGVALTMEDRKMIFDWQKKKQ